MGVAPETTHSMSMNNSDSEWAEIVTRLSDIDTDTFIAWASDLTHSLGMEHVGFLVAAPALA